MNSDPLFCIIKQIYKETDKQEKCVVVSNQTIIHYFRDTGMDFHHNSFLSQ